MYVLVAGDTATIFISVTPIRAEIVGQRRLVAGQARLGEVRVGQRKARLRVILDVIGGGRKPADRVATLAGSGIFALRKLAAVFVTVTVGALLVGDRLQV